MKHTRFILVLAGLALLTACGGREPYGGRSVLPPYQPPQDAASKPPQRTVPDSVGRIAGREVGGAAATFLNTEDRSMLERATQNALETGVSGDPVQWLNPETGNRGSIIPQPAFAMGGRSCREFHQTIVAGGATATGYGTACRDPRGTWLIAADG